MRLSMTATTWSMTGMIRNSPGPLTPRNLPARRMTNFSQVFAIFSAEAMMIAAIRKGIPKYRWPIAPNATPTAPQAMVMNTVMEFIVVLLDRVAPSSLHVSLRSGHLLSNIAHKLAMGVGLELAGLW